eukprot:TRINITY_DN2751_c0_g2_i5.p1 TRINITY_DN2751_c0_g2~~TRINITY_DN2751_c0_g2_i5.p1  ORF type:complete len:354 (+),score=59.70 TRINITY_DN2751_c0_g2_i5:81-1142(+)
MSHHSTDGHHDHKPLVIPAQNTPVGSEKEYHTVSLHLHPEMKNFFPTLVGYCKKIQPLITQLQLFLTFLLPYIQKTCEIMNSLWVQLQPYHPEEFASALFGLVMAFFGGMYFTTFAAIEAYKACGWTKSYECLQILWKDLSNVWKANIEDDKIDADGNGIPDNEELDPQQLALKKLDLVLRTVNPVLCMDAISGLATGFLAVVATLRVQFAQTITIGVSLGEIFLKVVQPFACPLLSELIPQPYHRWIPVIVIYGCKIVGVSLAWTMQRVISAFYSAIKGAELFANGLHHYLDRHNIHAPFVRDSLHLIVMIVAALGFTWQLTRGFSLPFPFNLLFFPITIIEWLLMWFVGVG